jgi:hypothetical protein
MIVERCFEAIEEPERLVGENAAIVGGFGSYEGCGVDEPVSGMYVDLEDMEAIHGVSDQYKVVSLKQKDDEGWRKQVKVQTNSCHTTGTTSSCGRPK